MTSQYHSRINSLERDIASLDRDIARESKKEADLIGRISRAENTASRSKNHSTVQSKLREIERYSKDVAASKKKQADLSKKRAEKSKSLRDYQTRQDRADETARKKAANEQRKLMREREVHERHLSSQLRSRAFYTPSFSAERSLQRQYDFFISHAGEDKDEFVRQLAEVLRSKGAEVWYDEFTLEWGDKLRRNIDQGLANSRYGIVVLSEHFFKKEWPQRELDGLVSLETASPSQKRILPIWHKVSKDEVAKYSPTLADTIALNTSLHSVDEISDKMMALIEEEKSHNLVEEQKHQTHLGKWLVENTPRGTNLEIPSRDGGEREIPFINEVGE